MHPFWFAHGFSSSRTVGARGSSVLLPTSRHDVMVMESLPKAVRSWIVNQGEVHQMGETWHPDARPKTEHSVSLDLAVSPKTEQTCVWWVWHPR